MSLVAGRPDGLKPADGPAAASAVRPDLPAMGKPVSDAVPVGPGVGDVAVTPRGVPACGTAALGLSAGWMIRDQELSVPELAPQSIISSSQMPRAVCPEKADRGDSGR